MGCGASQGSESTDVYKPWKQLWKDMHVKKGTKITLQDLQVQRSGWKTVRLYLASTFRDFKCERELLAKKIIPDLRLWCEDYKINLIEFDVRWGITADSTADETIRTLFDELDRCIEENVEPFIVSLVGNRVGWVPTKGELSHELMKDSQWIDGLSITEMEMVYGAFRRNNQNALFMIRDPSFLEVLPPETREIFAHISGKPQVLQEMIHARFPPEQVCHYEVEYKGVTADRCDDVQLGGLETFSTTVLEFLQSRIAAQYPMPAAHDDVFLNTKDQHEEFMSRGAEVVLGREDVLSQVEDYIKNPGSEMPLILLGESGTGKSSLMAKVADDTARQVSHDQLPRYDGKGWLVFYHFVGAVARSAELEAMLWRLLVEMKVATKSQLPHDLDDAIGKTYSALISTQSQPIIILIDGLDQFNNDKSAELVSWLPVKMAPQIRCIVSMSPSSPLLPTLAGRNPMPIQIRVAPLDLSTRLTIATEMLQKYSKKLDEKQMTALLENSGSQNLLWLSTAVDELRVFGNFRKVLSKVNNFAVGLVELGIQTIERWEEENNPTLIAATLCLIEVSAQGLLQNELLEILGDEEHLAMPQIDDIKDADTEKEKEEARHDVRRLEASKWKEVFCNLKPFLQPGGGREGLLKFYHRSFSESVQRKYFLDEEGAARSEVYRWWHSKLADYFAHSKNQSRKLEEYPLHLNAIGAHTKLTEYLIDWDVFDAMYDEQHSGQLITLWKTTVGLETMEQKYLAALEAYISNSGIGKLATHQRRINVSRLLVQAGRYKGAEKLVEEAIQEEKEEFGGNERNMAKLHHLLANIQSRGARIAQ